MNNTRLARSVSTAALLSVIVSAPGMAQDTRTETSSHTVKRGDTLWDLATQYLGDSYLWPEIYRLNTDQIEDPHWIYPGETLRLPGRTVAAAPVQQTPTRPSGQSVFSSRPLVVEGGAGPMGRAGARSRVRIGDVTRAPFYVQVGGPREPGRIMFGDDIPGIDKKRPMGNFQPYDRLLMVPPAGSRAGERDRFIAYDLGPTDENIGTMVVPTALLQVVRAPRANEPAIVQVLQLYGTLDADAKVIPLDTAGAGVFMAPVAVPSGSGRVASLTQIHLPAVLPTLGSFVLFDMSSRDGVRIGDEIQIYRAREVPKGDDGPTLPEIAIATGQVVKVTPFGATARITSQQQPAIRQGESVRITARMP